MYCDIFSTLRNMKSSERKTKKKENKRLFSQIILCQSTFNIVNDKMLKVPVGPKKIKKP